MITTLLYTTILSTTPTPLYHTRYDKIEYSQEYNLNYTHPKPKKEVKSTNNKEANNDKN